MKFQGYGEKRETSIIPQQIRERVFKYEIYSCDLHPNQVVKASLPARAIEGIAYYSRLVFPKVYLSIVKL